MKAEDWDARYDAEDIVWSYQPNATVERLLTGSTPARAIDLGAGEGRNAIWLASRGWKVTAVDFSAAGLDKASRLAAEAGVEVELIQADVNTYDLGERSWDLVLLCFLQIPNPARLEVLTRASAAVAPGGSLLVVAHDQSNVADGHGGPPDPAVCYTVEETTSVLDGFDLELAEIYRRPVETDEGVTHALDTVVLARRPA